MEIIFERDLKRCSLFYCPDYPVVAPASAIGYRGLFLE